MKKLIPMLLIFLLVLPASAFGHTALTSSSPAEGETLKESPEEIKLDFGTVIEDASTMTLESENESYEFNEIRVSDQSMTGTLTDELPNGAYIIRWNIIGADGHPIEGEITFALEAEETAADEETAEEPTEETTEESAVEEPADDEAAEEPAAEESASDISAEAENDGGNLLVTVLLAVAGVVLVFGLYKLISKKR